MNHSDQFVNHFCVLKYAKCSKLIILIQKEFSESFRKIGKNIYLKYLRYCTAIHRSLIIAFVTLNWIILKSFLNTAG